MIYKTSNATRRNLHKKCVKKGAYFIEFLESEKNVDINKYKNLKKVCMILVFKIFIQNFQKTNSRFEGMFLNRVKYIYKDVFQTYVYIYIFRYQLYIILYVTLNKTL